jgi:hypothetical protein
MKTFFYVLQKCIKSKKITYPDDPFEPHDINNYDSEFMNVSVYIYSIIHDIHYTYKRSKITNKCKKQAHAKLVVLRDYLNNIFISNELKEKILELFCQSQQIYFAMNKVVNIYRYKSWPLIVTNDLSLYPLDINHETTFVLLQNKSRYLFSMNDLINIIETAICNAPVFFVTPLSPKNPYNNQKLNTSTLCNIYFKMKEGLCKFSLIIHLFFLDCFVKYKFYINNEPFLREHAIKQYVYTNHSQTLYSAVIDMLQNNYHTNKLTIHEEFPKDILVDIFRPYLFYYYVIHYNIKGTEKINTYKLQLHIKLRKFYEYNHLFGRKIYTAARNKGVKTPLSFRFNSDHVNFYNIFINNSNSGFSKVTNISNILNITIINDQYDPDELLYTNELSNMDDEYRTDYEDEDEV